MMLRTLARFFVGLGVPEVKDLSQIDEHSTFLG